MVISGVVTQGREKNEYYQWITSFKISYGNSTSDLQTIQGQNQSDQVLGVLVVVV